MSARMRREAHVEEAQRRADAANQPATGEPTRRSGRDRWVRPFFKQYRKALAVALALGVATFCFASGLMFTSGYLIAAAAEMPGSILMIHMPTIFVRIFGIGKPILQYLERLTSHDWVLRMTSALRSKLYASIEGDAILFRRTHRTGDVLGLLAEDIGHLQNLYLRTVFPTVVAWLLTVVVVAVLGFFSLWFALAMLLGGTRAACVRIGDESACRSSQGHKERAVLRTDGQRAGCFRLDIRASRRGIPEPLPFLPARAARCGRRARPIRP